MDNDDDKKPQSIVVMECMVPRDGTIIGEPSRWLWRMG